MKIKISKINMGKFTVRDELDKEELELVEKSLTEDGQWNPIIVRPINGGMYELISGHYRFEAAKKLGWREIEATIKDVSDEEALFLAIKTNLIRKNMDEIEEAKVIKRIMDKYGLSQREIAKRLGKSPDWVSRRMTLILSVTDKTRKALEKNLISMEHANIIAQISENKYRDWEEKQNQFLDLIIKNKWSRDETRIQLKRFINDTIFTIGYQGKTLDEFIEILKNNKIEYLIDIRYSAKSEKKPEFNDKILEKELKLHGIKYEHVPQLGVPFLIQNPYIEGKLKFECVEQWYRWYIKSHKDFDFDTFVEKIKNSGRTVLMCMEKYAKPIRNQEYGCHRDILANIILEMEKDGTKLFEERVDL